MFYPAHFQPVQPEMKYHPHNDIYKNHNVIAHILHCNYIEEAEQKSQNQNKYHRNMMGYPYSQKLMMYMIPVRYKKGTTMAITYPNHTDNIKSGTINVEKDNTIAPSEKGFINGLFIA